MALKQCPQCGKMISTDATICPHCGGRTLSPAREAAANTLGCASGVFYVIGFGILIIGILMMLGSC